MYLLIVLINFYLYIYMQEDMAFGYAFLSNYTVYKEQMVAITQVER